MCALLGVMALLCGLLVPVHLRAVDSGVIELAGRKTTTLVEEGLALVKQNQLGAAQLLAQAAQTQRLLHAEQLTAATTALAKQSPSLLAWGSPAPVLEKLAGRQSPAQPPESLTEFLIRLEIRERALDLLRASPRPAVQELLRFRAVTNTTLFPPSQSSSGQALDTALCITGLLLDTGHLSTALSNSVLPLASAANRGADSQPFEEALMDLLSLGQRFNWGQLSTFAGHVDDAETLRLQANLVRTADAQLPGLYSSVQLSGNPAAVAKYVTSFSQTGLSDLASSLRYGAGGLDELLSRNQRLHYSTFLQRLAPYAPVEVFVEFAWHTPTTALVTKWLLYLLGGFFLAAAMHFARPTVSVLERPLQVRGFHIAREILFALGFLLAVLLLTEPFLAQESQRMEFPFRLRLPRVGSVVPAGITNAHPSIMNLSLLTLLLFFVLQGLLYTACLFKLAEIRRQRVPARIKLRLLENEDHLFDAGLYLGFAGTVVSLILVSLNFIQFSLMAAYSSTSFGIIFVSVFKIFHLRPVRRKLLLEAEAILPEATAPAPRPSLVAPS